MPQSADQAAYMVWGEVRSRLPDGYDWLQKCICNLPLIFSEYFSQSSLLQIWKFAYNLDSKYKYA